MRKRGRSWSSSTKSWMPLSSACRCTAGGWMGWSVGDLIFSHFLAAARPGRSRSPASAARKNRLVFMSAALLVMSLPLAFAALRPPLLGDHGADGGVLALQILARHRLHVLPRHRFDAADLGEEIFPAAPQGLVGGQLCRQAGVVLDAADELGTHLGLDAGELVRIDQVVLQALDLFPAGLLDLVRCVPGVRDGEDDH